MEKFKEVISKIIKRKFIIIAVIIVLILILLPASVYKILKDDFVSFANAQAEYRKKVGVSAEGIADSGTSPNLKILNNQTVLVASEKSRYNRIANMESNSIQKVSDSNYNLDKQMLLDSQQRLLVAAATGAEIVSKSKAEEIASKIKCLDTYIGDSKTQTKEQKLAYLMNAEIVTLFPYIDTIRNDSSKLNGIIKFDRYLTTIEDDGRNNPEKIRLQYIDEIEFEAKLNAYRSTGNTEVFNFFTMDENKNIVIAYGTKIEKTITTTDNEINVDSINNISTETYSKVSNGKYISTLYTANTKSIDYHSLVEQYVLPFNFLATLLVQTRDYSLVKEIADLAYNSEIIIGIYDNKTITEENDEYIYNKKIKYTENTKLIFDNINTDPQVNISSSEYSDVVKECFGKLDDSKQHSIHVSGIDIRDLETAEGNRTDGKVYEAYISEISTDGTVTGISNDPQEFKTILNIKTTTNSTPTVDVNLADIWAGKWTSTYVSEENNIPVNSTTYTLNDDEFLNTNKLSEGLLAESGAIGSNLKAHSEELRKQAIEKIIEKTDFSETPRQMTTADIRIHGNKCEECKKALDENYPNWKKLPKEDENTPKPAEPVQALSVDEVQTARAVDANNLEDANLINAVKTQENLAIVKEHVEEKLRNEAETKASEKKEKFIIDINTDGQITYEQWPTIYKANTLIKDTNTYKKESSYYKKSSGGLEKQGEKFSEILNDVKYTETREGIRIRNVWIWECLQEYEDTAKLENLIRYLFNIAYETDEFGEFQTADINKLFKMFEPTNLNLVSTRAISPFGTTLTKQEFIEIVENYIGGEKFSELSNIAETFYDICTSETYNVNPCLVFAWACADTEFGNSIENNNLFTKTLNQGRAYDTYANSIQDFCVWILRNENILEDNDMYGQYDVKTRIAMAKEIFGNTIFLGGEGTYQTINDVDYFGIYTSSAGRRYTEWKQARNTTWGGLELRAWDGTMAQYGCGLYSAAMLLNSVGIDTTPGDFHNKYSDNYNFKISMQSILDQYNANATVKSINSSDYETYILALAEGNGVMTYVAPGSGYTSTQHWIVAADIRATQIGSTYGYDVYILSSTHLRGATYGWVPIETVIDNLYSTGAYGFYISNN